MKFSNMKCNEFIKILSSKSPVPGGGGASAFVGAIGIALGNMVCNLTIGKKKYKNIENEIYKFKKKCNILQQNFLDLIDEDANVFKLLSEAYKIKCKTKDEENKKIKTLEIALDKACNIPMKIMEKCCESIKLMIILAEKGSKIAISDIGVGTIFCKAALKGASLNIYINTKNMINKFNAEKINKKADSLLKKYIKISNNIYNNIFFKLK